MVRAKILYVADSSDMRDTFDEIERDLQKLNIRSSSITTRDLVDRLKGDPNWSFIIVHVNYEGEKEIRQHFDEYVDVLDHIGSIWNLLKKYGLSKEDFED